MTIISITRESGKRLLLSIPDDGKHCFEFTPSQSGAGGGPSRLTCSEVRLDIKGFECKAIYMVISATLAWRAKHGFAMVHMEVDADDLAAIAAGGDPSAFIREWATP